MDEENSFTSIIGATQETAEPADATATATATNPAAALTLAPANAATSTASPSSTTPSSSSILPTTKKLLPKRATSSTSSPIPSRDSSPVRPSLKSTPSARSATGPGRSRKNSSQEGSPSRTSSSTTTTTTTTNPPSAAATQRALSVGPIPNLHPPAAEPAIKAPIPQKVTIPSEPRDTPRWPISPRLRSPPPSSKSSLTSPRRADHDVPAINVQRTSTLPEQLEGRQAATDSEAEDPQSLLPGMRTPVRGVSGASSTLETVQEISQPGTPALGLDGVMEKADSDRARFGTEHEHNPMDSVFSKTLRAMPSLAANESGSESGGKGEIKLRATSAAPSTTLRPTGPPTKSYSASAAAGRGKPSGEGSTKNMTVETETVSSIPQVAVGGGPGGAGNNGSLRAKPSSETIRPKKEKRKTARKTPSVASGTASSKADIFEAKVASAVDEANSSDSEETFVYESNPPDAIDRPRRYHSRTPSATSMASQADQRNGVRTIMDGGHSVAMKKSMKFANSYTTNGPEAAAGEDDGKGTARSSMGTGRGTTHHHHIGRWGRNGGNGHASLFDNESPFPNAAKSRLAGSAPRNSPRPTSPRIGNMTKLTGNGKKSSPISSGYDLDDGTEDERTPLVSTIRTGRSGRSRRPASSSVRQLEHQASRQNRSLLTRFAGCLVLSVMIILVISGAVGFIFAMSQSLVDVRVLALKNVLVSEQELILDMKVGATNPNLVVITIDAADLMVFAKSQYAGTDTEWWKGPQGRRDVVDGRYKYKRDDDPNDPPVDSDPDTSPNLEIGHVLELNSALTFVGSPFQHVQSTSVGEIRVHQPGNSTTPSNAERWGRVLQHDFDLIVRGTLKYTLPLGQKVKKAEVLARVTVKPNSADQDPETLLIT